MVATQSREMQSTEAIGLTSVGALMQQGSGACIAKIYGRRKVKPPKGLTRQQLTWWVTGYCVEEGYQRAIAGEISISDLDESTLRGKCRLRGYERYKKEGIKGVRVLHVMAW